jgi:hypothetical protein
LAFLFQHTLEVCPILSLALHRLTYYFFLARSTHSLFPGSNEYVRFRKRFRKVSEISEINTELQRMGVHPKDVGTHSMGNDIAIYSVSGNTATPKFSANHPPGGWALGEGTYPQYNTRQRGTFSWVGLCQDFSFS